MAGHSSSDDWCHRGNRHQCDCCYPASDEIHRPRLVSICDQKDFTIRNCSLPEQFNKKCLKVSFHPPSLSYASCKKFYQVLFFRSGRSVSVLRTVHYQPAVRPDLWLCADRDAAGERRAYRRIFHQHPTGASAS